MADEKPASVRSHKKLDPELKQIRAMNRAMGALPPEARQRCLEWLVAYWTCRAVYRLPTNRAVYRLPTVRRDG